MSNVGSDTKGGADEGMMRDWDLSFKSTVHRFAGRDASAEDPWHACWGQTWRPFKTGGCDTRACQIAVATGDNGDASRRSAAGILPGHARYHFACDRFSRTLCEKGMLQNP